MPRFFGPRSRSPLSAHLSPPALRPPGRTWLAVGSGAGLLTSVLLAQGCGPDCETLRTCEAAPDMAGAGQGDSGGATGSGGDGSGGDPGTGGTTDTGGAPSGGGSGGDPGRGGKSNGGSGGQGIGGAAGDPGSGGSNEVPPLCEGIDCQQDAVCQIVSNEATCVCEDGFEADGDSCQDIDECTDDPCQENEVCQNEAGSFSCSCAPGFYEDLGECWPDMVLVSAVEENLGGANGSISPAVTPDGTGVGFYGYSGNFGLLETNSIFKLLFRNMRGGDVLLAGGPPDGLDSNGRVSTTVAPALTSDGGTVAFSSEAWNLTVADDNGVVGDIFRAAPGVLGATLTSISSSGNTGNAYSLRPTISADGNRIAFDSGASNLVIDDGNSEFDVFVRDVAKGETTRISRTSTGQEASAASRDAKISGNGRFVAFRSWAALTQDDSDDFVDIYVKDLESGDLVRGSKSALTVQGADGDCDEYFSLSADGRFLVFSSSAPDVVQDDTNGVTDVFIRDLSTNTTRRVTAGLSDNEANGASRLGYSNSLVSKDGRYVVFHSDATNLIENDTNGATDVFIRDLEEGTTARVSVGPSGSQSDAASWNGSISQDGRFVAFESEATTFGAQMNGVSQVWYKRVLP